MINKYLITALIIICVFSLSAQEGADISIEDVSDTTGTIVATEPATTTPADTSRLLNTEILSPFYSREAESFSDGEIHYLNSECYFDLSAKDMGTGIHHVEYAIDESAFSIFETPFRIEEDGNHLLRYRGVDNSGNIEKSVLYQVFIDNTAPAVSIGSDRELYIRNKFIYCNNRTKFYIAAIDDSAGAGIRQTFAGTNIDQMNARGTGISNEKNFFKVADGTEGVHEFYYTAVDNVGNVAEIQKYNMIVDNTPPEVEINTLDWINISSAGMINNKNLMVNQDAILIVPDSEVPNKFYVNGNHTIAFNGIDPKIGNLNGSGLATLYVKINDEDFVKYKGPIQFQKAKLYTILIKAEDNAGNISEQKEFIFDLDFVRPESSMNIVNAKGKTIPKR